MGMRILGIDPGSRVVGLGVLEFRGLDTDLVYAGAIRAEYAHVPADEFGPRRAEVLTGFLERPVLYFTDEGRERWEARGAAELSEGQLVRVTGADGLMLYVGPLEPDDAGEALK